MSWTDCLSLTDRIGLALPSEAQWEYGCRGETETRYWTGGDLASLADAANLADEYGKQNGAPLWTSWEQDFDDGNTVHAEVGSYRANSFGLHDVHGNVWEWCLDGYDRNAYGPDRMPDPIVRRDGSAFRVDRGGSFRNPAAHASSANRAYDSPELRGNYLGLRPSQRILP